MPRRLRSIVVSLLLAMAVFGSALGVGFACAGEVPGPYYWDSRPPPRDGFAPTYLDGLGRGDVAVWEDGTAHDGFIDLPVSGAAP